MSQAAEARDALAVVEAAYVSGAQEALDETPEAITVLEGFISDYEAVEQERDTLREVLKRLPAAIRQAERFDARHDLYIPGDSALAVVFGRIEEDALRLGDPDEYHRIMSGPQSGGHEP